MDGKTANIDIEGIIRGIVSDMVTGKSDPAAGPDSATYEKSLNQKDGVKRVALGADIAVMDVKKRLGIYLENMGFRVVDVCAASQDEAEYPDIAAVVARKVALEECERGIVLDRDGIGVSMTCNKIRGIRAALCYDLRTVINSREHHNANVLALSGKFHSAGEICEMAKVWLETRFAGGERWAQVNKIMAAERG